MASTTLVTYPIPFVVSSRRTPTSLPQAQLLGLRRGGGCLRIRAVSKSWEPTKVVPQADRVLIRLEDLAEEWEKIKSFLCRVGYTELIISKIRVVV